MSVTSLRAVVARGVGKDPQLLSFTRKVMALKDGGGYRKTGESVFTETVLVYEKRTPVLMATEGGMVVSQGLVLLAEHDTATAEGDVVSYFGTNYRLSAPSRITFGGQVVAITYTLERIR